MFVKCRAKLGDHRAQGLGQTWRPLSPRVGPNLTTIESPGFKYRAKLGDHIILSPFVWECTHGPSPCGLYPTYFNPWKHRPKENVEENIDLQTNPQKQTTKTKASTTFCCSAKSGDQPQEDLAKYIWSQNK